MRHIYAVFALFLLATTSTNAEPEVIFDDGGIPTAQYLTTFQPVEIPDFGGEWVKTYLPRIKRDPENPSVWLPLTTSKLSPARIDFEQEVNFPELESPICIVGSDPLSLRWLRAALASLALVRARCWLVQAESFDDFSVVSKILNGQILMTPADGDQVADFFGIQHYPVIIDQRVISQ